jgi:hypothetical protein
MKMSRNTHQFNDMPLSKTFTQKNEPVYNTINCHEVLINCPHYSAAHESISEFEFGPQSGKDKRTPDLICTKKNGK